MRHPAILPVLLGALAAPGAAGAGEPPATFELSYRIASGEFGAPPETVTVAWGEGGARLRLRRDGIGDAPGVDATASLGAEEERALWALVEGEGLLRFRPRERSGRVFDFGSRSLKITAAPPPAATPGTLDVRWTRPLENGEAITRLEKELGRLVRARLAKTPSVYLP